MNTAHLNKAIIPNNNDTTLNRDPKIQHDTDIATFCKECITPIPPSGERLVGWMPSPGYSYHPITVP